MSQKFDHMQALTNFVITPLTFLSGSFYSVKSLPDVFEKVTYYNPIFMLIDGVRYGCLGYSEGNLLIGFTVLLGLCCFLIFFMYFLGFGGI